MARHRAISTFASTAQPSPGITSRAGRSDDAGAIELRVVELRRLFDASARSAFRGDVLDSTAAETIVDRSKDLDRTAPLALVVRLERPSTADEADVLRRAVHRYFSGRAERCRRDVRELFRRGRISLAIGLGFLAATVGVGDALARSFRRGHLAEVLREGLAIGGWVAMWRPLEVFLYDWWPIRDDARLFDRLAAMPIRVQCDGDARDGRGREESPPAGALTEGSSPDTREAELDYALAETFPASDPVSCQVPTTLVR